MAALGLLKRGFDFLASSGGLLLTLPVYPLIMLAIRLDSPGPVFYRQTRIGLHGKPFPILKFRTMVRDADQMRSISIQADERVTRVGRWLRGLEMDELPTLLNVLRGDMSVVGPRPELPRYVQHYTPEQRRVLSVRPGITDIATLRFRGEARLLTDRDKWEAVYVTEILPEKLRLNLEYIEKQGFFQDLWIIIQTLALIVRRRRD